MEISATLWVHVALEGLYVFYDLVIGVSFELWLVLDYIQLVSK